MRTERGSALLAVLWLSAALAAIAFSIATTVRGETERTATSSEGLRTDYIAKAAIDRAMLYILWGPGQSNPDGTPRFWAPGVPVLHFRFPSGDARVDIIPETAKFDINEINKPDLMRLLVNLGVVPPAAEEMVEAITDWRTPAGAAPSRFDYHYLGQAPSFRARHASLEEIEELLFVKGMTPELFHGGFGRDAEGRLVRRTGLKDCVSVYGSNGAVDVNHAEPAVLATVGVSPAVIPALVERRRAKPFRSQQELQEFAQFAGPGFDRVRIGEGSIFTLRATARLRLPDGRYSDLSRTAAALIKMRSDAGAPAPLQTLRWYGN